MVTEYSIRPVDPILPGTEFSGRPTPLVPRQIPWGYSRDRLYAVAVDPMQLFAYWELRDESIEAGRKQLGAAGNDAQLTLRVFDTSGRIFDGSNAHSHFDQDIHRTDRQWFCRVGKPASTAHVEIGLRTREGRFYRLARSARVDFPRNSPAGGGPVEWMRVIPHTGVIASRETPGAAPPPPPPGPPAPVATVDSSGEGLSESTATGGIETSGHFEVSQTTPLFDQHSVESWEWYERHAQHFELDSGWQIDPNDPNLSYRSVSLRWEELGLNTFRWETGPVESSWQAGPFSYPTEVIAPAVEHFEGPRLVMRTGEQVRVLHGPWQVVIRGINAHAEHRVLGRWEVHRSWVSLESRPAAGDAARARGRGVAPGASELRLGASELRLRGASEVFFLGASERRLGGASESRFMGASQLLLRGQSELRLVGQSELRLRGQSELRLVGASERRLAGQSELRMAGASERRLAGASERRLGGASERRGASELRLGGASEQRLGGASEQRASGSVERPPSLYPPSLPPETSNGKE
jgi:hypothetical protein